MGRNPLLPQQKASTGRGQAGNKAALQPSILLPSMLPVGWPRRGHPSVSTLCPGCLKMRETVCKGRDGQEELTSLPTQRRSHSTT
uniref:Uncharacterized protein n=1 Tax=Salarias fasciatus TaxID=181472 RepID=A0A672HEN4_SALFA